MPIDPNTGIYVNPIGGISPGGNASSALAILSDMLASQNAGMNRQAKELALAKQQHDYERQLQFEDALGNIKQPFEGDNGPAPAPEDQADDIALKFSHNPDTLLNHLYQLEYRQQGSADRQIRTAELAKAADDRNYNGFLENMQRSGMTNAQVAQLTRKNFPSRMTEDEYQAIVNSPKANEVWAPAAASKMALQGAQTADTNAKATTEAMKPDVMAARINLLQTQAANLRAKTTAIIEGQKAGRVGKVSRGAMNSMMNLQASLTKAIGEAEASLGATLGGKGGFPMTDKERSAVTQKIVELKQQRDQVVADLRNMRVEGDAKPDPGTVVQPAPPADGGHSLGGAKSLQDILNKYPG